MQIQIELMENMTVGKIKKVAAGIGCLAIVTGLFIRISNRKPAKYSYNWIKSLTDKEWEDERKIIWQKYSNPEYDIDSRMRFWDLLELFDKVKSDRDWAGIKPQGPSYHREHGYNLYKP